MTDQDRTQLNGLMAHIDWKVISGRRVRSIVYESQETDDSNCALGFESFNLLLHQRTLFDDGNNQDAGQG